MILALIFTLLAAIDILIVLKFRALGIGPMKYFDAGVATVFFIFIQLHSRHLKQILKNMYLIIMIFIYLITAYHVLAMLQIIVFKNIITDDMYFNNASLIHCPIAVYAIFLILLLLFRKDFIKISVIKWIISLAFFEGLKHALLGLLVDYPNWLYRYDGVIDLGLIFSWMMIIFTLIDQEYTFGISRDTKTFIA